MNSVYIFNLIYVANFYKSKRQQARRFSIKAAPLKRPVLKTNKYKIGDFLQPF